MHRTDCPETNGSKQHRPLVLIAEDNRSNADLFANYLESAGIRTHIARDGQQAIELTKELNPDLVLMDIHMPKIDGLEAIRLLRKIPEFFNLPIFAFTALAMQGDEEQCLKAGASAYYSKPIKMAALAERIWTTISASKQ